MNFFMVLKSVEKKTVKTNELINQKVFKLI